MTQQAVGAAQGMGAVVEEGGTRFRVWAPASRAVDVMLVSGSAAQPVPLLPQGEGWFEGFARGVEAGTRYRLRLDGGDSWPDPWSRSQPDGVHGPSEVADPRAFPWTDNAWTGVPQADLVIHEIHVGTATPAGTFDALIERLPEFAALGVTALEIMPVAEFPGGRNWGYDGVYLFAPARAYGGGDGLCRFVDAAHRHGLAVILDVVYNHFGPEGNYMPAVTGGRIFTEKHHTPWGAAVNYDDDGADAVRATVLENVRQWISDYHIDGLRLDATHAILDESPTHILREIGDVARAAAPDRAVVVIAEDETNDRRLLLSTEEDGYGLDGVWADDAHHVLRRLVAGDSDGYYRAYDGTTAELERVLRQGWLYEGEHYEPRGEARGTPSKGLSPMHFVHCIQNHDQVGNRALGERIHHQVGLDVYRAMSALLLLTPYTPLLWMGQEWAASTPFLYFTDHLDELGRLVTEGRRNEFAGFSEFADPALRSRIPDPQAAETFARSKLDWSETGRQPHAGVLTLYRELLHMRREHPALLQRARDSWDVAALSANAIALRRSDAGGSELLLVVVLRTGDELDVRTAEELDLGAGAVAMPASGNWALLLSTEEPRFGGSGTAPRLQHGHLLSAAGPCAVLLTAVERDAGG